MFRTDTGNASASRCSNSSWDKNSAPGTSLDSVNGRYTSSSKNSVRTSSMNSVSGRRSKVQVPKLAPEDLARARELFDGTDDDVDGQIDVNEFRALVKTLC